MNAMTAITKDKLSPRDGAQPPRLGEPLRKAIDLRVKQGLTILAACKEAGITEAGWHKAMKRPAVLQHLQAVQLQYIQEVEAKRATYRARAFDVAAELMETATSESVRMRAVEFFAGEAKQPGVVVQVNQAPQGYTYERPQDRASGARPVQAPDIIDHKPDVAE